MENKHPGRCYRCLKAVDPGHGYAHKNYGRWWVQHKTCHDTGRLVEGADGDLIVEQVPVSDPEYIALGKARVIETRKRQAAGTGENARRARKWLREAGLIGG